jgi:hypothetical protein
VRLAIVALVLVFAVGTACRAPVADTQVRTRQQVTDFFTSGPQAGLDPDVGLYHYNFASKWEHVATIHSFRDADGIRSTSGADFDFCETVVAALKAQPSTSNAPFECRVLNKHR